MGQVSLPGIVLCLEVDGRVTLEEASEKFGCKSFLETDSHEDAYSFSAAEGYYRKTHCGPCTDIPISVSSFEKNTITAHDLVSQIKSPMVVPFLISLPKFVEFATGGPLPQPPPAVNSTITSLQTSILLC